MTRFKVLLLALALLGGAFGFFYLRYSRRLSHDTFNQHLAALAGSDAVCCSRAKDSRGLSFPMEHAMTDAFADATPFWARDERHYRNIHGPEQWDVSEGFVLTSTGDMFQLDRHPPTFFRPARIAKYRINNPNIQTRSDGSRYLALHDKTRLEVYTLDP